MCFSVPPLCARPSHVPIRWIVAQRSQNNLLPATTTTTTGTRRTVGHKRVCSPSGAGEGDDDGEGRERLLDNNHLPGVGVAMVQP